MLKKCVLVLVCAFSVTFLSAQRDTTVTFWEKDSEDLKLLETYEDSMAMLSQIVLRDTIQEYRMAACKTLVQTLVQALKVENSFQYPFNNVVGVSIMYPEDSSFRTITWQLYVDKDTYRYFGAIQKNAKELDLIPLMDRSNEMGGNVEQKPLTNKEWYGALYYNIRMVESPFGKYYLLFGFDGDSFFNRRKVLDVLTFEEDGSVLFGAPVFMERLGPNELPREKLRVLVEYSAEAAVKLNYSDEYGMIIHDYLIPFGGNYEQGPTMVPDGSYSGYKLEKDGKWYYMPKVFNDFQETAPMPAPVLDTRGDGLFGPKSKRKPKKKKRKKTN